jgi:hypothetical protein
MIFTTVRLERPEGTALLHGIPVQIEQAESSDMERVELEGARPYDAVSKNDDSYATHFVHP